MLRNYHMCISQFFISHYLPPFHPSNLIIDQGSPRKKSNSKACGAIFMLLATFSWSELFHELCMHQCHLEKKSKNTFGFSRPTAEFDFPFGQRPQRGRWPMLSHRTNFSSFSVHPPPSKLISQLWGQNLNLKVKFLLQGPNSCLEAQISASRLKSQPWGSNPSLEAQIPALRPKS